MSGGEPVASPDHLRAGTRRDRPAMSRRGTLLLLGMLLAGTFSSRLLVGLHTGLDSDEATNGVAAYEVLHGHLVLMESNYHYLGALETYLLVPFVWALGPTLAALRVGMAAVGCVYVLALYDLGRTLFMRRRMGLLLAAVGAVFPLFELTWTVKARYGYAETMIFAVFCLSMATRIGWREGGDRLRNWVVLGLAAGVGTWNDIALALPLIAVALALLCRAAPLGWRATIRHSAAGIGATAVGFSPWIAYNATHGLASLANLPSYPSLLGRSVKGLVVRELPIFTGTASSCGHTTVSPWFTWIGLGALAAAVLWLRRRSLARLLRGHLTQLEPVDMVLAVAVIAVGGVVAGRFSGAPCEPRYLLPLAIPLALGATLVLAWPRGRAVSVAVFAAYLVVASFTGYGPTVDSIPATTTGVRIPPDRMAIVTQLESRRVSALFADYWVARPITYLSGTRVDAAVYDGPIGFPHLQRRAERDRHAGWLFVVGDPDISTFISVLQTRRITATAVRLGGYVLFTDLSRPLPPQALSPGRA